MLLIYLHILLRILDLTRKNVFPLGIRCRTRDWTELLYFLLALKTVNLKTFSMYLLGTTLYWDSVTSAVWDSAFHM